MYWKPPQTENNPANPFWHPLNKKTQPVSEAVTVELDFKKDADGKRAGGKMVRKGVYKMTFKNNAEMNKFMDTHADKLNEEKEMDPAKHVSRSKKNPDMFCVFNKDGEEVKLFKEKSDAIEYAKKNHDALMESTPAYRKMMKRYKGSDNEKVFKMLRAKGYKVGEQDDTLVQNLLKRHRGNVKKVVDQIVKDYPGKFDVERMMMDHVEIDEDINESILGKLDKVLGKVESKLDRLARAYNNLPRNKAKIDRENKERMERVLKNFDRMVADLDRAYAHVDKEEQLDEMSAKQHYNKMVAQGKVGRGGRLVTPIDRKRFPNREREGLEGPFRSRKSGQVYYYDKKAGKYYDPLSDMYLQVKDVMETRVIDDFNNYLAEGAD